MIAFSLNANEGRNVVVHRRRRKNEKNATKWGTRGRTLQLVEQGCQSWPHKQSPGYSGICTVSSLTAIVLQLQKGTVTIPVSGDIPADSVCPNFACCVPGAPATSLQIAKVVAEDGMIVLRTQWRVLIGAFASGAGTSSSS